YAQQVPLGDRNIFSDMDVPQIEVVSVPSEVIYFGSHTEDFEWTELGDIDDPASKIYKKGYNLILEEEWEDARKVFAELIKNYPKSDYLDDAHYWSAYALMNIDEDKAVSEYKLFIKNYPKSSYCDDAVADLNNIDPNIVIATSGDTKVSIKNGKNKSYSYSFAPSARDADKHMKLAERKMQLSLRRLESGKLKIERLPSLYTIAPPGGELNKDTQLKMEALHALGEKEDSDTYQTLKEIVLNKSQHKELRITAMMKLVDFKKNDPLPIFLEVAKNDTSEEIQNNAIDFIGMRTKDKNRSVEILIELFNAVPERRKEQREVIFYSIAEIGNDNAVDFLTKVARTNEDYDLRLNAIHYLGSIGSKKSRTALYEILREK
ncbi:MAG TPA: HEAT repeat domain-containing protein, partial [Bacteroidota bacterium]|nr:HEAT repeat domain-containing protein [Bacteroidota bacterium]